MPWTTIIFGIFVWTILSFAVAVVIKLLIDLLPSDHMDKIIEKEDADFVSFQLKRKELESMMQNIQGAREEIKEIIQKIDEVTERGEKDG
jgi:hypothetical protein